MIGLMLLYVDVLFMCSEYVLNFLGSWYFNEFNLMLVFRNEYATLLEGSKMSAE